MKALFLAPAGDFFVVAPQQNLGNAEPAEFARAGVLSEFQQPAFAGKRIVPRAAFVAEHARHEPDHRVDHDHRRHLAAAENIVADRQFLGLKNLPHAVVETFVSAAEKQQPLVAGELFDDRIASTGGLAASA